MSENKLSLRRNWYFLATVLVIVLVVSVAVAFAISMGQQTNISNPVIPQITPNPAPYYLEYPGNMYRGNSSILLLSATASYGHYPFASVPQMGSSSPAVHKGDPCLIINVTLRNDYTDSNPVPGQNPAGQNSTTAYLYLTAQIFNQQGLVQATDVTPPYPPLPLPGAFIGLDSDETGTATIYLATSHQDITHFAIVPEFIGAIPPP